MSLNITSSSREIAKRIRRLIARNDGGDVTRAAHRLGLPVGSLCQLERILEQADSELGAELLAAVVHRYGVDASWLLTGEDSQRARQLEPETRRTITQLLTCVGDRILADYRSQHPAGGARAGV